MNGYLSTKKISNDNFYLGVTMANDHLKNKLTEEQWGVQYI